MTEFYRLTAACGTRLVVDRLTRWMLHMKPAALRIDQIPVLFVRLASRPGLVVCMACDDDLEMIYPPQGYVRTVQMFKAIEGGPGQLSLIHGLTRRAMAPAALQGGEQSGGIAEAEPTQGPLFAIERVETLYVARELLDVAMALDAALGHSCLSNGIIACLNEQPASVARVVLRGMLQVACRADYEALSRALLRDPAVMRRLGAALSDEIWIAEGLLGLDRFLRDRDQTVRPQEFENIPLRRLLSRFRKPASVLSSQQTPRRNSLGKSADNLATEGLYGRIVSFGHALNHYARLQVLAQKRICVLATARNEGVNLVEWVAYHRCLGIERIFLYSNDNIDRSDSLLKALDAAGVIDYIDNQVGAVSAQQKAYGHALNLRPDILDYEWCLVIDLDEVLVINPDLFSGVEQFLREIETRDADAIALNWVMIGSDGDPRRRPTLMTERYRRVLGGANAHIKSLFRPRRFVHSGAHFPHSYDDASFTFRNAAGRLHVYDQTSGSDDARALSTHPDMSLACVFHYFFKSADEYLWKFSRNRGDSAAQEQPNFTALSPHFIRSFVGQERDNAAVETDWTRRCAPELRAEISRLMAFPGVAEAQQAVDELYNTRVETIRDLFRMSDALRAAGPDGADMLEILG